ncbi:hypothetical protein V6N12_041625 [Hibiscus sabdariffa]|uniref:Uncharacterized protein n=1 Tax=Hibiscus sabdariffa TaxID=183260 RepID=A0ABR2B0U6_9ROSI
MALGTISINGWLNLRKINSHETTRNKSTTLSYAAGSITAMPCSIAITTPISLNSAICLMKTYSRKPLNSPRGSMKSQNDSRSIATAKSSTIESMRRDERYKNINKFLIVVKFGVFGINYNSDDSEIDERKLGLCRLVSRASKCWRKFLIWASSLSVRFASEKRRKKLNFLIHNPALCYLRPNPIFSRIERQSDLLACFDSVTTGIHQIIRTKLVPQTTSPALMPTKVYQNTLSSGLHVLHCKSKLIPSPTVASS